MYYFTPSGHVVIYDDEVIPPGRLSIGSHGYAQIWDGERVGLFHRWLLGLKVGDPRIGDHINRNPLDNRLSNLRAVTPSGSNYNRGASDAPRLAYRCRDKWAAKVKHQGVMKHLGSFETEEEARQVSYAYRAQLTPV